jgi:phosphatidate cytidylyltransferase
VLSAVSQVGDLIASLIKREHGVKDYGNIFPGHGGVMDRFDSVLSITAILMVICILFPPFA